MTTQQDSVQPEKVELPPTARTYEWPQPTFDQVIGRWYQIGSLDWSYTSAQDTTLFAYDVSKILFNIQTLFDRVKRFRYWRANAKVRIQVNSTPFHYGSIAAAIVPYYSPSEVVASPVSQNTWGLSGQKCFGILSANTGKPLELTCPFQTPHEYLAITQQADVRPFYLSACVMNPLRLAGNASNPVLRISIFAQFDDFKILGPSEATANSSSKKVVAADKEQRNATKQGTLGKVAGVVSDVAGKLTTVPVIGSIASLVAPVSSAIGKVFDYFGWDKPTNISAQVFTISRPNRGMQFSSGQDPAEPVGLKPDQKISTETSVWGVHDEATRAFLKLIQTPMRCNQFTIANAQVPNNVFKAITIQPYAPDWSNGSGSPIIQTQLHDYLSYYSQFFGACRGGYKYILYFDTSSYTSARVRITFEPSTNTISAITDGGDSFSRIVDVNGATTIALEVPYCYPSARMPISQGSSAPANGQLLFSLVNPIQTNGGTADVIYVQIFRCAADDFRFYQLLPFTTTYQGALLLESKKPAAHAAKSIWPNSLLEQVAALPVCSLGDGPKVLYDRITEDEEVVVHNDFLHRYHTIEPFPGGSHTVSLFLTSGDPYHWLSSFRAYRGAVRLAPYDSNPVGVSTLSVPTDATLLSQGAYLPPSSGDPDVLPIEVPYNNNIRFVPMRYAESNWPDAYNRYFGATANLASHNLLWACGDDFTIGLRCSPEVVFVQHP